MAAFAASIRSERSIERRIKQHYRTTFKHSANLARDAALDEAAEHATKVVLYRSNRRRNNRMVELILAARQ